MNKDIGKIVRRLRKCGWQVNQGKTHYKAHHPKGGMVVFSVTPSCCHAIKNIMSDIKKVNKEHKAATVRTGEAGVKVDIAKPPRKKDTQKGQVRQG